MTFRIAGQRIELDRVQVEQRLRGVLPEPVREHYVVIAARRFPPKQVLSELTGLDRADFTTHQARRILRRLGFTAARAAPRESPGSVALGDRSLGPFGGRQAKALAPHSGRWVALGEPTEVLVAADTPQELLAWLARHDLKARGGLLRVPLRAGEAEGLAPL